MYHDYDYPIEGSAPKETELKHSQILSFVRIYSRVYFKCTVLDPTSREVNLIGQWRTQGLAFLTRTEHGFSPLVY